MRTLTCYAILTIFGCSLRGERVWAEYVFQDLGYIGAEPSRENLNEERDVLAQPKMPKRNAVVLPTSFAKGMQYLFVCREDCPVVKLAIMILPRRLQDVGARHIRHPTSPSQFVYIYIGGPLFTITFELGNQKFRIRNTANQVFVLEPL